MGARFALGFRRSGASPGALTSPVCPCRAAFCSRCGCVRERERKRVQKTLPRSVPCCRCGHRTRGAQASCGPHIPDSRRRIGSNRAATSAHVRPSAGPRYVPLGRHGPEEGVREGREICRRQEMPSGLNIFHTIFRKALGVGTVGSENSTTKFFPENLVGKKFLRRIGCRET